MTQVMGMGHNQALQYNLADPMDRKRLTLRIEADVDEACRAEFAEDPRTHLGASIVGEDCQAKIWGVFRWLKFEVFSGQQLRLFNRGHEEEARFIRWLTLAGFEVQDVDPETKKQFRIVGCGGHFGGSLDSKIKPPIRYGVSHLIWLGEFKTHNDKSFLKLAGDRKKGKQGEGVILSKPMHYRQMCSYGRAYGYEYGLYCAVNKNTDELYFEIVWLDWRLADDMFRKAEGIIRSQVQPPRIAQTPSYFDCKYCDQQGICYRGESPTKNCRSCANCSPLPYDAKWHCAVFNSEIPAHVIPEGCNSWRRII